MRAQKGWCKDARESRSRQVADFGRVVGVCAAVAARPAEAGPVGSGASSAERPGRDGRYSVRAADGLPVECLECHGHLLQFDRPPSLSGMAGRRRVPETVANQSGSVRRAEGTGLAVAEPGRSHDQGPPGRGEKPAPTPPIGPSRAPSEVCWSRAAACRWDWPWPEPTSTTSS
jgi:hypothetical protein